MNWLDNKLCRYPMWRKWRGLPEPMPPAFAAVLVDSLKILNSLKFDSFGKDYDADWSGNEAKTVTIRRPKRYTFTKDAE